MKPGCTVTAFYEADYAGAFMDFMGPITVANNVFGYQFSTSYECSSFGWGSWKSRCQQSMIDCMPTDSYETVLWCDNTEGVAEVGN